MSLLNLSKDEKALKLAELLTTAGYEAYFVGGCVRDALLNKEPHDIDICTNALPEQVLDLLHNNSIYSLEVGVRFGTVIAILERQQYEITTYRCDGQYTDNRRPDEVQFVDSLQEDLSRRDFTVNAMAFDPHSEGNVLDYFQGQEDLTNKLIRTVNNPNERFQEDALRILRALRFAIRYNFRIEAETGRAIHENKDLLKNISKERITSEFEKMLTCGQPIHDIFLEFSDVIATVIPEIEPCIGFDQNNKYHFHDVYEHMLCVTDLCKTDDFNTKLAALLHDIGKPDSYIEDDEGEGHFYGHPVISGQISERVLKNDFVLSTADFEEVLKLITFHDAQPCNTDKSVRKLIINIGKERIDKWFILKQADIDDHNGVAKFYEDLPEIHDRCHQVIENENCFKVTDLKVSGTDVMSLLGIRQGKKVGEALKNLFDKVVEGEVPNDRDSLLEVLRNEVL